MTGQDGTTAFPFGVVTYSHAMTKRPEVGNTVVVETPAYRTYAFEFRNRL